MKIKVLFAEIRVLPLVLLSPEVKGFPLIIWVPLTGER